MDGCEGGWMDEWEDGWMDLCINISTSIGRFKRGGTSSSASCFIMIIFTHYDNDLGNVTTFI